MNKENPFKGKVKPWITFVMPCYNDAKRVGEAIASVIGQDYPYLELIVVNDGSTDKSVKAVKVAEAKMTAEQKARFKFISYTKNKGAGHARNLGAAEAKGKYLSFLPADAYLKPGVAKFWVKELEDRPDFDFIYGGYRFIDEKAEFGKEDNKGWNYVSDFFDAYTLETSNYIDGSFPLKKELFEKMGGWDPEIKSLQDWEFWLRAVRNHGARGLYVPAIFFETTIPHKGGLSHDSATNWLARTDAIKNKLGIPIRKTCVVAFGAQFHAIKTAKLLNADFSTNPNFKPNHYETLYFIGGYPQFIENIEYAARAVGGQGYSPAKKALHWIGSDLLFLRDLTLNHLEIVKRFMKSVIDVHLVEAEHTKKELKELLDIDAKIVPLPSERMFPLAPLPEEDVVAVYMPDGPTKAIYMPELMEEVANKMPDVRFIFYGLSEAKKKKKNIEYRVFDQNPAEYRKLVEESKVLARLTIHDGLPLSVAEFASAGRNIVTNVPIPHVRHISGDIKVDGVVKTIRAALKDPQNVEGSKYYNKIMDHDKFRKTMAKISEYDPTEYWEARSFLWNKQAAGYLDKKEVRAVQNIIRKLSPEDVLDVGCGNGQWAEHLPMEYLGIDIAQGNIDNARANYPDRDFRKLKLEDAGDKLTHKFDLAFCHTIFMHIKQEDIDKAVQSLKKVARKAIIIEPTKIETQHYQVKHDIEKLFKVERRIPMAQRTMYVVNLEA